MSNDLTRSFCNACGFETDHDVVWKESRQEDDVLFETQTVRCRGCRECAIVKSVFQLADDEQALFSLDKTYEPPRLWRRAPNWLPTLESIDVDLSELLTEVYSATNPAQVRLLAMGVRAALDHVMTQILGADLGGFDAKLDQMVAREHLTPTQRQNLATVIDAGSASQHRGYAPPQELLEEMLSVTENIIRDHYITGPMLATAKQMIPPRPPRPPRAPRATKPQP